MSLETPVTGGPGEPEGSGAAMLDTIPQNPALVSAPRLLLTQPRVGRAVLDGAWWPRSWDSPVELSDLVLALSEHYGRIRSLVLNGSAWTGRARKLAVAGQVVRIGWFASMTEALLVAITDVGDQVDLLIVPPGHARGGAEWAMARAADPGNTEHAPELLARAARPAARVAEDVWDNEGGNTARSRV